MIEWGIWCLGVDEVSTGFLEHTYHPEGKTWVGHRESEAWCDWFSSGFADRVADMLSFSWEEEWFL